MKRPVATGVRVRARSWLLRYWLDVALCALLVVLTLFVRWASLEPIESGGDPLDNWFFVKQWAYNTGVLSGYLNHHNSRFGIHWLTWIVQQLFGTHPVYYYVAPVFASTVCSLLVYLLGRQVASRAVGVVAALMLLEFNGFIHASSQLRPSVFEAMYVLGATNLLVFSLSREGRKRDWTLAAAGFVAFLAWLAKEPTVFFVPGMCLVLAFSPRRYRDVLIFAGVFAALVGLETLAYNIFTNYPHRAAVIMGSHGRRAHPPRDIWFLFARFTKANDSYRLVFYFYFAAALSLLASRRAMAQKAVVLVVASFLFLATFGVRRIDPIVPWMNLSDRYLDAAVPVALVACAMVIVEAAAAGRDALTRALSGRRIDFGAERWQRGSTALALTLLVGCLVWKTWALTESHRAHHPLTEMSRFHSLLSDAYARGLPIIGPVTAKPKFPGRGAQVRSLHWAMKGFVDEKLQLDEKGELPHFNYARSVGKLGSKARYVPLAPHLSESSVRRMQKEKPECVLVLRDISRGPTVKASNTGWRMPEHCGP